jgi:Na+/glutamate symporter
MILPAVCIFSAIGFDRFLAYAIIAFKTPRAQILATVVLLLVIGILNLRFYWGEFAFTCKYDDANAHIASYMGESLGNLGNSYHAFFMGAPRYRYGIHPSTDFLSNNNIITNVDTPITAPPVDLNAQAPVAFYFVPERANELTFVQKLFPNGQEERINDCGEPLLVIYHVP